jgi:hypothetical protein
MERAGADMLWFIALAEQFDLNPLKGAAYYALMMQGRDKWTSLAKEGKLTREHLGRLHSGYYLLVRRWEHLRVTPPIIPNCTHSPSCLQKWQLYWKEAMKDDVILNRSPADILGRLGSMVTPLQNYKGINALKSECRSHALEAINTLLSQTKKDLASIFVDIA